MSLLNTSRPDVGYFSTFEAALVRTGDFTISEAMLAQSVARMRVCGGDNAPRIMREIYPEITATLSPDDLLKIYDDLTERD
jgi:hypothetical protein